jgi:hypothetical protein
LWVDKINEFINCIKKIMLIIKKKYFYILKYRCSFLNNNFLLFYNLNNNLFEFKKNNYIILDIFIKKLFSNKISYLFNNKFFNIFLNNYFILYFNKFSNYIKIYNLIKNNILLFLCYSGYFINIKYLQNINNYYYFFEKNFKLYILNILIYIYFLLKYIYINNLIFIKLLNN